MKQPQTHFWPGRNLVWFSCGAASAAAAHLAVKKYGMNCKVVYCDTSLHEHPDNLRFLVEVEEWIGIKIERIVSKEYPAMDIYEVFTKERRMKNQKSGGAVCTDRLKRQVRIAYQWAGDNHIFGYTSDEQNRIKRFEDANPSLDTEWILADAGVDKSECYRIIKEAGIELPMMYKLGYSNNNCIGCVKGGKGYWNKIRRDFPETFERQSRLERYLGASVLNGCYLDELDPSAGRYNEEPDIECGAMCVMPAKTE